MPTPFLNPLKDKNTWWVFGGGGSNPTTPEDMVLQTTKKILVADINLLRATPIEILPALSGSQTYIVHKCFARLVGPTGNATGGDLNLIYSTSNVTALGAPIFTTAQMTANTALYSSQEQNLTLANGIAVDLLHIKNSGAAEYSFTGATLNIYTFYSIYENL